MNSVIASRHGRRKRRRFVDKLTGS